MKLNAVNRKLAVAQSHDFAFARLGSHFEYRRQGGPVSDKGMISRRLEWIRQVRKQTTTVVFDRRSLAMHESRRPHDFTAEGRGNALMTQTNAEHRFFTA